MPTHFEMIQAEDHLSVLYCSDKETKLKGFIALHDLTLGPAMGGVRIRQYQCEEAALQDVLDLSRAMTYKSSLAQAHFGGGKAVIMLEEGQQKTPEMIQVFAKRVHQLAGNYIAVGDYGSTVDDLHLMAKVTPHVSGVKLGDSGILTGLGVFCGIEASVAFLTGDKANLKGMTAAVQGVGKVGARLVRLLIEAGAQVTIADINANATAQLQQEFSQIKVVAFEEVLHQDVDIISPCATGGPITQAIAESTRAKIIAGGANNILETPKAGEILFERGVVYAPDFTINCGGILLLAAEVEGRTFESAEADTRLVFERTLDILNESKAHHLTPEAVSVARAKARIMAARTL